MKRIIIAAVLVVFSASLTAPGVWAHGGGTDKNGCHMDRKAGTRHCH